MFSTGDELKGRAHISVTPGISAPHGVPCEWRTGSHHLPQQWQGHSWPLWLNMEDQTMRNGRWGNKPESFILWRACHNCFGTNAGPSLWICCYTEELPGVEISSAGEGFFDFYGPRSSATGIATATAQICFSKEYRGALERQLSQITENYTVVIKKL